MLIIVLRVFERMGETPGLNYDSTGKIQNPSYEIKLKEFEYMNKWIPRFQMMGYVRVDFVDAYEIKEIPGKVGERIPLPDEKYAEMKKALTDKIAGVEPPKSKSPFEVENEMLKARLERQDQAIERLERRALDPILNEMPKPELIKPVEIKPPKPPKFTKTKK